MANGRYYWLKLKRDFFKRHDIRIIEAMPNGKDYILFYLKLLCESVDHEGNLRFSEQIPYNEEMLATITNTDIDVVRSAVKIFSGLDMIEVMDDGTYFMNEVQKMIGSAANNDNANRQRRYRERQKLLAQGTVTETVTKSNESKSKNKSKNKDIYADVPKEIKEPFMEWAKMRQTIKKPITTKATVTRALNKLNSLAKTTEEKIALIELATDRCWQSFYLPRAEETKPAETRPRAYKEFEKEDWERDGYKAEPMPENMRETYEKLNGMFGGGN